MRIGIAIVSAASSLGAQEPPSFHRDVLPILRESCAGCHQPAKSKGGVVLTSHDALVRPLDGAEPVVVRGHPDRSLLLEVVVAQGGSRPAMPEDGEPLDASMVAVLRAWIAAGAIDDTPESARGPARPDRPPVYRRAPVIATLAWSSDSRLLAVPGRNEVLLIDVESEAPIGRLVGMSERIEAIALSPDGARLAAVGGAPGRFGEVQVWDLAERELAMSRIVSGDSLFGVSWSPDGRFVAFGATDTAVRAIDATTGAQVLFQGAHDDWVLDTAFSTDGSHLVTVGRDRSMKLTKFESQQFVDNITSITPGALKGGLMAVARHPTRDELLVGGADGTPRIYRMYREQKRKIGDDFNLLRAFEPLGGRVFDVAFVGDGTSIVAATSGATGGEVRAYLSEDGTERWRCATPFGLYAAAPSPDGRRVAVGGFDGVIRVLDADTGAARQTFVPFPIETASAESEEVSR